MILPTLCLKLTQVEKEFFQYNFVVRILPNINDGELRAIFQRLNKNVVALNKQELRQATYSGAFIKTMNALSDREAFSKIGLFTLTHESTILIDLLANDLDVKSDSVNLDEYIVKYIAKNNKTLQTLSPKK